jgi:hypothetical protein
LWSDTFVNTPGLSRFPASAAAVSILAIQDPGRIRRPHPKENRAVKIDTLGVQALAIAIALMLGLAAIAQSQSLDIKPGLWKKKMTMETGGRTVMDSTIEACMTADDLDLKKTADKLTQSPSCKVVQQDLSPNRLTVVLQCKEMVAESTTEVRSRDSVVVIATMKPAGGGEVTHSREEWSFVKADCGKQTAN